MPLFLAVKRNTLCRNRNLHRINHLRQKKNGVITMSKLLDLN